MDLARSFREIVTAALVIADELILLGAFEAYEVLAILAFDGEYHDIATFWALKVLVEVYITLRGR